MLHIMNQFTISLPNVANGTFNATSDGMNHDMLGYISAYRSQFINMVSQARKQAAQVMKNYTNSLITAYLSFNNYANYDLDLHVYEPPNSTHIYWNNTPVDYEVNNGELILTSLTSGPEYYHTTKC